MDRDDAQELLRNLFSDPDTALSTAHAELVPDPDPFLSSIGHQVVGIVLRDRARSDEALTHLRKGLRLAGRTGDVERVGDVRATLGTTLARLGRVRRGWRSWTARRARSRGSRSPGCWFGVPSSAGSSSLATRAARST